MAKDEYKRGLVTTKTITVEADLLDLEAPRLWLFPCLCSPSVLREVVNGGETRFSKTMSLVVLFLVCSR